LQDQFVPSFVWRHPTRVRFGVGSLKTLTSEVAAIVPDGTRVFLVVGRQSLRARGILQPILDSLRDYKVTVYDRVAPFPSPQAVDDATAECRSIEADIVVAIGGGSVMDLAKAVAILAVHEGSALAFAQGEIALVRKGLPFIAAPTTSGSSSEVTSGSALWDMDAKKHYGLGGPLMFPDTAIVDPELMMSMPSSLAAITGMDAFTSAFESYWSIRSQPISDALNLDVIRNFTANLERSTIQGDLESRAACAIASTMSGIAYSQSPPNACHAVGGPLTLFWDVQHGQAVGVTLCGFLERAAPAIRHKLPPLWEAMGVEDLAGATELITRIMRRCGLETTLTGLGLNESDLDTLVDETRWERVGSLPVSMGRDELRVMLAELF